MPETERDWLEPQALADLNPVEYTREGTAVFHAERALALRDREESEWQREMDRLERASMRADADPQAPVPRATVRPAPLVPGGIPGLQDIHTQTTQPGERFWEQYRTARARPKWPKAVAGEPATPPPLEETLREALRCVCEALKCGPVFTQPTTWLAPPVTAISVDVFTSAAGVTLPGGSSPAPGAPQEVIRLDVPDRFICVIDRFGNELEDTTSFGDVRFSMQRNRAPLRSYGDFDVQLGRFVSPNKFGSPIILKHKDRFRILAQSKSASEHRAFARIQGWCFAVRTITGDGRYSEFCVQ